MTPTQLLSFAPIMEQIASGFLAMVQEDWRLRFDVRNLSGGSKLLVVLSRNVPNEGKAAKQFTRYQWEVEKYHMWWETFPFLRIGEERIEDPDRIVQTILGEIRIIVNQNSKFTAP